MFHLLSHVREFHEKLLCIYLRRKGKFHLRYR